MYLYKNRRTRGAVAFRRGDKSGQRWKTDDIYAVKTFSLCVTGLSFELQHTERPSEQAD